MQNYLNFAFLPALILIYLILVYPSQDINKSQNVEGENVELQPQSAFTNINKYKYNHTSICYLKYCFLSDSAFCVGFSSYNIWIEERSHQEKV